MILTALLLGLAGSFHCVGMCSPLAMAVTNRSGKFLLNTIVYNTGRIITYAIIGSIIAGVGFILPLHPYQGILSIALGITLLTIGLTGTSVRLGIVTSWLTRIAILIKGFFLKFLKKESTWSTFLLGILNGLLPCGLTFMALTYCITLSGPFEGFYFMLLFGAGTIPAMVGLSAVIKKITGYFSLSGNRLTTIMFVLTGVLLILRVFMVHIPHAESLQQGAIDIVICRQ